MIWNKLNAKSFTLLHEYMHRDVCDTHQLRIIDNAQVMTESIIDDVVSSHAAYQAYDASSIIY